MNNISNWARDHVRDSLAKNVASPPLPCPKNMPEVQSRCFEAISLAEMMSRHLTLTSVVFSVVTLSQGFHGKEQAGQKEMEMYSLRRKTPSGNLMSEAGIVLKDTSRGLR